MRKIIFEQTGNIIITIILTCAMTKTILESKYSTEVGNLTFEVKFGFLWTVFLIVGVLFSIAKYYYSKKKNSIEGYKKEDGEFSAYDEREIKISLKSTKMVYRVITHVLSIMMIILMYSNIFVQSREYLRIIGVVALGISLISIFLTYMISWIIYDSKL